MKTKVLKGEKALNNFLAKLEKNSNVLVDIKFTTDDGIHHFLVLYRD